MYAGWHPVGVPGAASLHVHYSTGTSGSFLGTRGYVETEFLIDGQIHYGWIDLDNHTWLQTEIHGWAYESEPGKGHPSRCRPQPSPWLLLPRL